MRKVLAVFVLLAVACTFVACNGDKGDTTTTIGISTTEATTTEAQPLSYVLTTNPDKTVPYVETTRFEISDAVSVPVSGSDVDINVSGNGDISKPDVNIGNAPTVITTTKATTTTKVTTTKATTTQAATKKKTDLPYESYGVQADNETLMIEVSNEGWGGGIKANSTTVSVQIDGESIGSVPIKIAAKEAYDGVQEIVLDLSGKGIVSGSNVTFTIPEGFLTASDGGKYSAVYTFSGSY